METGEGEHVITLEHDRLVFRFLELHPDAEIGVSFQRTLRIPDDGNDYPLPPGLGAFALRHIDDYAARLPERLTDRGGVILPMYQAEAMWLSFRSRYGFPYPFALKIGTGKTNAVTGAEWSNTLSDNPQDYIVLPGQPWLDGYCIEKGVIRQFVAAPFNRGITVEEQIMVEGAWGGVQLLAFPMKIDRALALRAKWEEERSRQSAMLCESTVLFQRAPLEDDGRLDLGLACGGRMRQTIYEDPHGIEAWDQEHGSRCFVTILDSAAWTTITGEAMPTKPIEAAAYANAGLPWFDYHTDQPGIEGSSLLGSLKSIVRAWKLHATTSAFDTPIATPKVKSLGSRQVREMGG